jgi:hypothetical protein
MNKISKNEWVIGLNGYLESPLSSATFSRFYAVVACLIARLGVTLTHVAAEGEGYSGKLVKANNAQAKRLVESEFEGITVLSCVVSPEGSKEPAYDRVISATLSLNSPNELLLCIVVNDGLAPFLGETFEATLLECVEIDNWSFGYAFRDLVERQPDFHVLSLDNGRLSKAETLALRKWYASTISERIQKLRSVYPVTIANEKQLARKVEGGTLGEFMQRTPGTIFEQTGKLSFWRVHEAEVERLRELLREAGVLIT